MDKGFETIEIFSELFRSKFIITGLISFVLLSGAGVLSLKRTQRYTKARRAFVYTAMTLASVHIFLGVKVAGVVEYFCLLVGFTLLFKSQLVSLRKTSEAKFI